MVGINVERTTVIRSQSRPRAQFWKFKYYAALNRYIWRANDWEVDRKAELVRLYRDQWLEEVDRERWDPVVGTRVVRG